MTDISLTQLFASGHIVDLILVLILFEGLFMAAIHYYTGKGIAPLQFLLHTIPGVFLFLALRAALVDADWQVIALLLAISFLAHIIDIIFIVKRA